MNTNHTVNCELLQHHAVIFSFKNSLSHILFSILKYLIHDRDTKYCAKFKEIMNSADIECIKLPPRSPNLNAFAERWVKTVKTECLNHFILFGRRSLSHVLKQYLKHYHSERNHQGVNHKILFPDERLDNNGEVIKSSKLGGLLNFYHRDAA